MKQITLKKSVTVQGIGLHSGKPVTATLHPAPINHGIIFKRLDKNAIIPATPENTAHTPLQTKLLNTNGIAISTPEHLLAAFAGLNVDNCLIELSNEEVPILDGSALPWVKAIDQAERVEQLAERHLTVLENPLHIDHEGRVLSAVPDQREGLRLEIFTDFPILGKGHLKAKITEEFFRKEIAPARTFCFEKDVKAMQKSGLALGGSLENAVVFDENGHPLNPEGLRFSDEVLRHKYLDAMGDLYLGGAIQGKLSLTLPGHTANNILLRKIFEKSKS